MDNKTISAYFLQSQDDYIYGHDEDDISYIFDTKLGGMPYVPKRQSVPKDENGQSMVLLFQINYEELPDCVDFPQNGMMQIFIANRDFNCTSGIYDSYDIAVRFYDMLDYSITTEDIDENNYPANMTYLGFDEARYIGNGATLNIQGEENVSIPLGSTDFNGIIVGGSIETDKLEKEFQELIATYPEHTFPLLRINSSELFQDDCDFSANYQLLVSKKELKNKQINRIILLLEYPED